ncbi:MAG TPA: peptidylprolyl isomerase [Oscillospiraceae bacterium]|nr:peptidylprolyl isomerase [Oscillospiraceae bacterium]
MNGIGNRRNRKSKAPLFVVLGGVLLLAVGLAFWVLPGAEGLRSAVAELFHPGEAQSGEEDLSQGPTLPEQLIWQGAELAEDDRTAVFTTDAGEFTVKLQPESEAAAAFAALVEEGVFDGMTIDRSVEGRYLQTSVVAGDLPAEDTGLAPICGAAGFVSEGGETSLFFITTDTLTAESSDFITEQEFSEPLAKLYAERGGVPELTGVCTVFGTLASGDLLLKTAAAAETSGWVAGYTLAAPVTVLSVRIVEPAPPEESASE